MTYPSYLLRRDFNGRFFLSSSDDPNTELKLPTETHIRALQNRLFFYFDNGKVDLTGEHPRVYARQEQERKWRAERYKLARPADGLLTSKGAFCLAWERGFDVKEEDVTKAARAGEFAGAAKMAGQWKIPIAIFEDWLVAHQKTLPRTEKDRV